MEYQMYEIVDMYMHRCYPLWVNDQWIVGPSLQFTLYQSTYFMPRRLAAFPTGFLLTPHGVV